MTLVIKKTSGGVAVMRLVNDGEVATCLAQWKEVNPGEYVSHAEVAEASLPADRSQRAQWDLFNGAVVVVVPPLDRAALAAKIDAAVAAIYERPMTYSKEYEQRESQAQTFKNAGYLGTVPPRVAGFATSAGMTAQAATDLILQQAAQLRGALDQLSDLRMRKYELARAASDAAAQTAFNEIMAAITAVGAAL